jgi:two-component system sensor histidine kinase CpxA
LIAVLTSGIVGYFLASYLTAPIIRLRQATQKLAAETYPRGWAAAFHPRVRNFVTGADFDKMAEQIENLVNAQSRLLKDISHELRSPLARLTVALELARHPHRRKHKPFRPYQPESSRMNELIGSLMTISRLESGAGNLKKVPVELEQIIDEVARAAASKPSPETARLKRRSSMSSQCSATLHPARMIENGEKCHRYTADGSTVKIRAEAAQQGNAREAVIVVSDAGPGVPADSLDRIFRPFYRIDDARGRSTGGVGLGLAITEQAVRLHGGSVRASNLPEGGLSVEIRLPLQVATGIGTHSQPVIATLEERS